MPLGRAERPPSGSRETASVKAAETLFQAGVFRPLDGVSAWDHQKDVCSPPPKAGQALWSGQLAWSGLPSRGRGCWTLFFSVKAAETLFQAGVFRTLDGVSAWDHQKDVCSPPPKAGQALWSGQLAWSGLPSRGRGCWTQFLDARFPPASSGATALLYVWGLFLSSKG